MCGRGGGLPYKGRMNRTLIGIAAWTLGLSTVCAGQTVLGKEEVEKLVADLASPKVLVANAAINALGEYVDTKTTAEVRRQLEGALTSANLQKRHGAAQALRGMKLPVVSAKLIEVTVDGLRNDNLPGRPVGGLEIEIYNAAGFRWLIGQMDKAREPLVAALGSDDLQQRFLAAVCLGAVGDKEQLGRVAEILLPHLRDNQIKGDALLAGSALYRLGPALLPRLNDARLKADDQQRQIIDLMLYDFNHPPTKEEDFGKRKGMQTVWPDMNDPVAFYAPENLDIQWRGKMTEARRDNSGPVSVSTDAEVREFFEERSGMQATATGVIERRKTGVFLVGPELTLWIGGEGIGERYKDGERVSVQGRLEEQFWPDSTPGEKRADERGDTGIMLRVTK